VIGQLKEPHLHCRMQELSCDLCVPRIKVGEVDDGNGLFGGLQPRPPESRLPLKFEHPY
jgi:hypothetical protein